MPCSLEQFAKSLSTSGLMTAEDVRAFHATLPAAKRRDVPHFATELVRAGKITRFQAAALYQEIGLSLVMGEYLILDKIGSGGMGQVFKAEHQRMKRIVALKLLPAEVTKDEQTLKRFEREVVTAAHLIHPNIVTAYDAGKYQGVHYLIMEFVDGQDLSHLVKKQGTLPIETAVNFLAQAARGLEYAHGEGVIHRDIKPGNLLVDKKGNVKILDMGLARVDNALSSREAVAKVEGLTGSSVMMGTVDYMAPEQAIDTHTADHRSDIYSLGCTLFYLLTGRRMFEGETLLKRILAHRDLPRPTLASLRPDLPASLETVFQRMVGRLPDERYATMAAARQALEECLARMDTKGDSSVYQFDNAADEDLASFLKNIQVQSATSVAAPIRLATETLVSSQPASDTKPVSRSRRIPVKQLNWPIVIAAVIATLVVALLTFMLLSRLSPRPEKLPRRTSAAWGATDVRPFPAASAPGHSSSARGS